MTAHVPTGELTAVWVDFTRPEFNENLSLVGAAGLVRRNKEGVK